MVCFRHDETLPLASTGTGRSGTSVIGGDIVNDNQIIDPAAAERRAGARKRLEARTKGGSLSK